MREAQAWTKIKTEKPGQRSQKDYSQHNPYFAPQAHRVRFIHTFNKYLLGTYPVWIHHQVWFMTHYHLSIIYYTYRPNLQTKSKNYDITSDISNYLPLIGR